MYLSGMFNRYNALKSIIEFDIKFQNPGSVLFSLPSLEGFKEAYVNYLIVSTLTLYTIRFIQDRS